jgi:hypothetical protein
VPYRYRYIMGEPSSDVRVRTRYTDRESLIAAVGRSIEHGRIRVPMLIDRGRAFELTITTRGGAIAVKGSAEVVAHDNGSTWIRFVSANDDQTDHGIRYDLNDAEVIVPATLLPAFRANPESPEKAIARGTPLPGPLPREDRASAVGTAPPPSLPTATPIPAPAPHAIAPETTDPVKLPRASTPRPGTVVKSRPTPQLIASIAIAAAGAIVAISAVIWARGVASDPPKPATTAAIAAPAACPPTDDTPAIVAPSVDPTPTPAPAPAPAPIATTKPEPAPPAVAPPATPPGKCTANVTASADNVTIWIDGESRGTAPATLALPCEPVTIVMRHPRYDDQSRKIEPTADGAAVDLRMQRPRA